MKIHRNIFFAQMGGMSGTFQFFDITFESGKQIAMVLKRGGASNFRASLGTAREAHFYKNFGPRLSDTIVLKSYCSEGNMKTGEMFLLLECANNAVPGSHAHTTPHRHDTTRHNTTQHNTTQHNTTQHNTTQHRTETHNLLV